MFDNLLQPFHIRRGDLRDAVLLCQLDQNDGVWDDDSEQMVLERITMDEDLGDDGADRISVLDLLERDVFALGELHDVLYHRREEVS